MREDAAFSRRGTPHAASAAFALVAGIASLVLAVLPATTSAASAPSNTAQPTLSGTPEVGSTLNADKGTWTGDPGPTFTYQWQRCEGPGGTEPGADWTTLSSPAIDSGQWRAVAYGGQPGQEKYVAVGKGLGMGSDGKVMTSPDGVTWTLQTSGLSQTSFLRDVTWGGGLFVAVGDSGIVTSPDGITWTRRTAPNTIWSAVTYGGGLFVAITSESGSSVSGQQVITSPDGIAWTSRSTNPTNPLWGDIAYGGGKFVAVGSGGFFPNFTGEIMSSSDGVTWTPRTSPVATPLAAIAWGNGRFVATSGFSSTVITSTDGEVWSNANPIGFLPSYSLGFGGPAGSEAFLAIYNNGTIDYSGTKALTSSDGLSWTVRGSIAGDPSAVESWGPPTWGGPAGRERWVTGSFRDSNPARIAISPGALCTDITGANSQNYTLTSDDEGKKVRVKVTGTNSQGAASANSLPTATIGPQQVSAPANTIAPTVSGTLKVGEVLTANRGTWTGYPAPTYTYQWQRCDVDGTNCLDSPGATSDIYNLTGGDAGKTIRVKVTGTNSQGSTSVNSPSTATVPAQPSPDPGPGPDPGPTPSGKPRLKVSVTTPRKVRAGKAFTVKVEVRNRASAGAPTSIRGIATTTARNLRTCAKLPRRIFVVKGTRGRVDGRSICWTRSSLTAGRTATYRAKVRSSKTMSGSVRIEGTVSASNSSGDSVKASSKDGVKVVEPAKPKPRAPTG